MDELWCEDCNARFREQCHCPDQPPSPTRDDRWVGVDGHAYRGDQDRPSTAYHDTQHCRCPESPSFDPERWF